MADVPAFSTIRAMLEAQAAAVPEQTAFLLRAPDGVRGHWTYRQLWQKITALGTSLAHRKLTAANIAVCGRNTAAWALVYLTLLCGGGTAVPLDRQLSPEGLLFARKFTAVKAVFADRASLEKMEQIRRKLPKKLLLICLEPEAPEGIATLDDLLGEGEALLHAGDDTFLRQEIDPQRTAELLFTSGSTDTPKVVMLSNENLCFSISAVQKRVPITQEDSVLCVLPLHHAYQSTCMLLLLSVGGTVSFCASLRQMAADMKFYQPTIFVTVPLMLEKMHKRILRQLEKQGRFKKSLISGRLSFLMERFEVPDLRKYVFALIHDALGGRLRMIIVGAAALDADVARDFSSFGIPVLIGYGLTECAPIVLCNSAAHPLPDGVGQPLEGLQVILDDVDDSGVGEICVKGKGVMLGYYKNKKATTAVLQDGWLRTGDLAYKDDSGNYHITGRIKNVIVTKGGKNIYPEELEAYLNREPLVLESLIFGDSQSGEETVAVQVVPDEDAIRQKLGKDDVSQEEIQSAIGDVVKRVNRRLPSYKSIRRVFIRDRALEKTSTQKPKRSAKAKNTAADDSEDVKKK